jgi:hypothetical protein
MHLEFVIWFGRERLKTKVLILSSHNRAEFYNVFLIGISGSSYFFADHTTGFSEYFVLFEDVDFLIFKVNIDASEQEQTMASLHGPATLRHFLSTHKCAFKGTL